MATNDRSTGERLTAYVTSRKHLAGTLAGLVGVGIALAGVGGRLWPLIVVGLYGAAALAVSADPARPDAPGPPGPEPVPAPGPRPAPPAGPPAAESPADPPAMSPRVAAPPPAAPPPAAPPAVVPPPASAAPLPSPTRAGAAPAPPAPRAARPGRLAYALGLDVGTTFSTAATWRGGRAEAATLGDRGNAIPSVLYLRDDGVMLVGDAAQRRAVTDPGRVAREFKRRLGDDVPIALGDRAVPPEELTTHIVRWIVDLVAQREGSRPDAAVVAHPAGWQRHRRAVLADAVAAAGLPGATLVPEPVAAALYYADQERVAPGTVIGVYDLGGGTFDATILRRTAAGFEIVGRPHGDDRLGGLDIDQMLWEHVTAALDLDVSDPSDDPLLLQGLAQLRAAVVAAKESLSSDTHVVVPVMLPGRSAQVRVTRQELEEMARPALARTVDILRETCTEAKLAPEELDGVLLVGGSSRIPLVASLVTSELGRPVSVDAHPKLAVCLGAALAAASRLDG